MRPDELTAEILYAIAGPARGAYVLTAFIDESMDSPEKVSMTVGGVIGDNRTLLELGTKWHRIVSGYGVDSYHAVDCHQKTKQFLGFSDAKREAIVSDLIHLLVQTENVAFLACSVDLAAYRALSQADRELLGGAYGLAFEHSLERIHDAPMVVHPDHRIAVIFEERRDYVSEAMSRYDAMKAKPRWATRLASCSKASKDDFVLLQVGDLVVYWANKVLVERERVNASDRLYVRSQFTSLSDSEKLKVCEFDDEGLRRRLIEGIASSNETQKAQTAR